MRKFKSKMMAIFMPAEFKSLNLNNLLKLQQQQQHQQQQQSSSSQIFTNESLFKPYFNNSLTPPNVSGIMTELNSESAKNRLCSEDDSNSNDSELSVGQEKVQQQQQQLLDKNSVKESPHSDDEMSNASSSQYTNSSTRLCSPQEMMRPSMQFHEEILRSSQLYAEELLRQRIAAAARLQSTVTDVKGTIDEPEPSIISKLSFQTSLFNSKLAAAVTSPTSDNGSNNNTIENGNNLFCAKSAINFQNIHSHLSSIAQITQNLSSGGSSSSNNAGHHHMKKDDASLSSLSRESSQSPSGFQQFKLQQHNHHHLHHPHHHHPHQSSQQKLNFHTTHQNQLHEHNLKFSIDNILKADFGRRITEPLLKSSRMKRAQREGKHEKDKVSAYLKKSNSSNNNNNGSTSGAEGQLNTNDKSMDQTYNSSTATTADNNNSSTTSSSATRTDSSGNVWPAWVSIVLILFYFIIDCCLKESVVSLCCDHPKKTYPKN